MNSLIKNLANRARNWMQWPRFSVDKNLKRLAAYLPAHRKTIGLAVFFMICAGAASSLIAALLGRLTDAGFYDKDPWIVVAAPLGLVGIAVLHGGSMFMSNYLLGKVSQRILVGLRAELFHRILRWPAVTCERNGAGRLSSKFVFEANVALTGAIKSCITLVRDSIQVIALSITLFWNNWSLAIVTLVIAPIIAYLLRTMARQIRAVMSSSQKGFSAILTQVREAHRLERLIKISNTYSQEQAKFANINEELKKTRLAMVRITSLGTPLTQLICMCAVAVVLLLAMFQASRGLLTVGEMVTFLAALLLLMPPLRNLAEVNTGFAMMSAAAQSIFRAMDEKLEDDQGKLDLSKAQGDIEFRQVCLRYPKAKKDAVHNFSLNVRAGQCVALVGLSGSGKTSLVNMIPRFWNPTSGTIAIDGKDMQTLTLASLRQNISMVSQDVLLFDDTLHNNVVYGAGDVSDEELWDALRRARLEVFVQSLPEGLETKLGESGGRLSGGQRQRVAIARALLRRTPILILDEATSALDSQNEAMISQAIEELMVGKTTFIVAHRLKTIDRADIIVAMEDGLIREVGTKGELLARNGLFAELVRLQSFDEVGKET